MLIARGFYRRSIAAVAFEVVWLLVGAVLIAQGWIGIRDPRPMLESARNSYGVVIVFGGLAILTALTHLVRGRLFSLVGGLAGLLLGLYGVALILLGTEDVGGLRVSLPAGLTAIALGSWTIVRVVLRVKGSVDAA